MASDLLPSMNCTAEAARKPRTMDLDLIESEFREGFQVERKVAAATSADFETPVETYANLPKVPDDFVIKDPRKVPKRCWGDDDRSKPDFEFPTFDISPLMKPKQDHRQQSEDSEASKRVLIEEIGSTCEKWGFFWAVNHGVPQTLLDRVLEVSHEFFQLPLEEKLVYSVKNGKTEGYGRLDFLSGDVRFWDDAFRHQVRPKRANENYRMPNKPAAYRSVIEEYTQGLERVFEAVGRSLSLYLGLGPDALQKAQGEGEHLLLRLNYYPKCAEPEKVLGVGAHKDFGSLSAMLQDDVGGLQVQPPGTDRWLDVKPKRGSLFIQIANQVEILSNGKLHSPMHRALVNRHSSRLSVAAFLTPAPTCIISPMQELLEKTNEAPRYTQLLYGDYIPNFQEDVMAGRHPHARYEISPN